MGDCRDQRRFEPIGLGEGLGVRCLLDQSRAFYSETYLRREHIEQPPVILAQPVAGHPLDDSQNAKHPRTISNRDVGGLEPRI